MYSYIYGSTYTILQKPSQEEEIQLALVAWVKPHEASVL